MKGGGGGRPVGSPGDRQGGGGGGGGARNLPARHARSASTGYWIVLSCPHACHCIPRMLILFRVGLLAWHAGEEESLF